jgi:hypothetical protein
MGKMLDINGDALGGAFDFDTSSFGNIDFTGVLDPDDLMKSMPVLPAMDLTAVLDSLEMSDLPLDGLAAVATAVLSDYLADRLPDSGQEIQQLLSGFGQYLAKPETLAKLAAIPANSIDIQGINDLAAGVLTEYLRYCGANGITDPYIMIAGFPSWLEQQTPALTAALDQLINRNAMNAQILGLVGDYLTQAGFVPANALGDVMLDFSLWLSQPDVSARVQSYFSAYVDINPLLQKISLSFSSTLQQTMGSFIVQFMNALQRQLSTSMAGAMSQLTNIMSGAMGITPELFQNMFQFNMDQDQLAQLMLSLMGTQQKDNETNLKLLGYANAANPSGISIYPIDFVSKQKVLNILDDYNSRMKAADDEDKVIVYTDIVGALMSSVTEIIDMISMVLVAFVAISLIVSSIMIGIVTYISVLERKKEIGILRSIGASKRNVGNVFNAETLIIGLSAGIIGILITALICIPANIIVSANFDVDNLARLPLMPSIILISISCLLSFVAGLIPSAAASRRDPVEALRSE